MQLATLVFDFICSDVFLSGGEVKRSELEKLSTQLYRKKVYYSRLFKTIHVVAILWS